MIGNLPTLFRTNLNDLHPHPFIQPFQKSDNTIDRGQETFATRASVITENFKVKTRRGIEFEERTTALRAAEVFLGWSDC
jgi:hypothetical protein